MSTALLELNSYIVFSHTTLLKSELEAWFDSTNESDTVLAFLIYEFFPGTPEVVTALNFIRDEAAARGKNLHLIADNQYKQYENLWEGIETTYISYWAMFVKMLSQPPDIEWNRDGDHVLFLTGKMHYMNRIGALASAHKSGLIKHIKYSFPYANENFDRHSVRVISKWGTDPSELMSYLRANVRITDLDRSNIPSTRVGFKDFEFYCDIMEPTMFTSSRLSIVSESGSRKVPTITEKVWKSVAAKHPFILMAIPGTHDYLNSIGIRTLADILPVIETGNDFTVEQIDNAIEQSVWFLTHKQHDDNIQILLNNNKLRFEHLASSAQKTVIDISKKFDTPTLMFEILNRSTPAVKELRKQIVLRYLDKEKSIKDAEWSKFYSTVRSDSWPEFVPLSDVHYLAPEILAELDSLGFDQKNFTPVLPPQSEIFIRDQN